MNNNHNHNNNNHNHNHLGVNNIGKNIKKSILPNPVISQHNHHNQRQIYNINKNDFRNIVQRLTGSPSQESPPSVSKSMRLQRIRPPPLSPVSINSPRMPVQNGLIGPAESPCCLEDSVSDGQQQNESPGLLLDPRMNGLHPLLPSPTSQVLVTSPGYRDATPLSPIFPFSPICLPGILSPGPGSRISSPRWKR